MLLGKRPNESEPSENHKGDGEGVTGNPAKKTCVAVRDGPSSHDHFRIGLYDAPTAEVVPEMPNFLTTCGLCKNRLLPGHDIYMYRGDQGYCTSECRDLQIQRDEDAENRALKEKEGRETSRAADPD